MFCVKIQCASFYKFVVFELKLDLDCLIRELIWVYPCSLQEWFDEISPVIRCLAPTKVQSKFKENKIVGEWFMNFTGNTNIVLVLVLSEMKDGILFIFGAGKRQQLEQRYDKSSKTFFKMGRVFYDIILINTYLNQANSFSSFIFHFSQSFISLVCKSKNFCVWS